MTNATRPSCVLIEDFICPPSALTCRLQGCRPPEQIVDHDVRLLLHLGQAFFNIPTLEMRPKCCYGNVNRRSNRRHLNLDCCLAKLLDGSCAHGAAVAHKRGGLSVPLRVNPIDGIFKHCGGAVVVFRRDILNEGKKTLTTAMMVFLARWARRLSWREAAEVFQVSWEAVYGSVQWLVAWGLAHRRLSGVESIGVDEIHWGRGLRARNFLTLVYQIDAPCRRLLWVGQGRSKRTLRQGLKTLGSEVVQGLRFVCTDMWKQYLEVIAAQAGQALHVLDRFHITLHLNQAVDQVRRERAGLG